ncbi:hypothetical protein FRC09_016134 [Ceratobasidium sp. 395]|nr:hypothetical protein FRC09_016134 [Ceratobasidium sp. 395]
MARAYTEYISLAWNVPPDRVLPPTPDPNDPKLPAPPPGTNRLYLSTPSGPLELLYALPNGASISSPTDPSWKSPILFQHGGFGSANCYANFLPWFAARGYPAYSLSLRGHGRSWYPGYWAMACTPKSVLADDVVAALTYVQKHHPQAGPMALVGHSAGGGLSQHLVDSGKGSGVGKLVIIAGFPCYGGWRVYVNWVKNDPWFPLRILKDLYHMRSPLSSTRLVHRAFFSPTYSIDKVRAFETDMAPYESMSWPSGMMTPFVSCARVLSNLFQFASTTSSPSSKKHTPLLVVSGAQDMLMRDPLMKWMANQYAATNVGIGYSAKFKNVSRLQYEFTSGILDSLDDEKEGPEKVWFAEITAPGAGHNLMRDDGWERCARVVEAFLDQ